MKYESLLDRPECDAGRSFDFELNGNGFFCGQVYLARFWGNSVHGYQLKETYFHNEVLKQISPRPKEDERIDFPPGVDLFERLREIYRIVLNGLALDPAAKRCKPIFHWIKSDSAKETLRCGEIVLASFDETEYPNKFKVDFYEFFFECKTLNKRMDEEYGVGLVLILKDGESLRDFVEGCYRRLLAKLKFSDPSEVRSA